MTPVDYTYPGVAIKSSDVEFKSEITSIPLPAGAATQAIQTTQLTALNSIITGLQSLATSVKQDTANTSLASILSLLGSIATSANQGSEIASLNSILSKYTASTATITTSAAIPLNPSSVKIIDSNPNRKGLIIYNNSANSIYLAFGSAANSSTNMTAILTTFNQYTMVAPIYTGPIYATRNAGSGAALITELT